MSTEYHSKTSRETKYSSEFHGSNHDKKVYSYSQYDLYSLCNTCSTMYIDKNTKQDYSIDHEEQVTCMLCDRLLHTSEQSLTTDDVTSSRYCNTCISASCLITSCLFHSSRSSTDSSRTSSQLTSHRRRYDVNVEGIFTNARNSWIICWIYIFVFLEALAGTTGMWKVFNLHFIII